MIAKEIRTEPDLISVDDNINSQRFEPEVDFTQTSSVKILGLNWNVETDEIQYDLSAMVNYASALPPTKRSVLRLTAKIFVPLGLLSPFTITMKIMFQILCNKGVNWDDSLDGEALAAWKRFVLDLSTLNNVQIP